LVGAGDNEKNDLNNLMGYDGSDITFAVPLFYLYTDIALKVYHVSNPTSTFINGSGHDNVACGHLDWPCKTVTYAIEKNL
jgi:hypothetical protein